MPPKGKASAGLAAAVPEIDAIDPRACIAGKPSEDNVYGGLKEAEVAKVREYIVACVTKPFPWEDGDDDPDMASWFIGTDHERSARRAMYRDLVCNVNVPYGHSAPFASREAEVALQLVRVFLAENEARPGSRTGTRRGIRQPSEDHNRLTDALRLQGGEHRYQRVWDHFAGFFDIIDDDPDVEEIVFFYDDLIRNGQQLTKINLMRFISSKGYTTGALYNQDSRATYSSGRAFAENGLGEYDFDESKFDDAMFEAHPFEAFLLYVEQNSLRPIELFKSLDTNKDGKVDTPELDAAIKRLRIPLPPNGAARIMAEMDLDDDGSISYRELLMGHKEVAAHRKARLAAQGRAQLFTLDSPTDAAQSTTDISQVEFDQSLFDSDHFDAEPLAAFEMYMRRNGCHLLDFFNEMEKGMEAVKPGRRGTICKSKDITEVVDMTKIPLTPSQRSRLLNVLDFTGDGRLSYTELMMMKLDAMVLSSIDPEVSSGPDRIKIPATGRVVDLDALSDLILYSHYRTRSPGAVIFN